VDLSNLLGFRARFAPTVVYMNAQSGWMARLAPDRRIALLHRRFRLDRVGISRRSLDRPHRAERDPSGGEEFPWFGAGCCDPDL